jgi:uncharacterized protein YbjT (DUF2867 family)
MKIVIIGGSGRIGSKTARLLRDAGHEVGAASPSSGVDAVTGQGLAEVLAGAQVVVDVANSPSFEAKAALAFFEASARNLLAAEAAAGVGHHVVLSVVGTDRLPGQGYFEAKLAQERLIKASGRPYSIVRATQFFEFIGAIADVGTEAGFARLSPALFQPIAADDVAAIMAEVALAAPLNATIEIAGPERAPLVQFAARYLQAIGDPRQVVADVDAGYFGAPIDDCSLTPGDAPRLGATRFEDWLRQARANA